MKVTSKSSHLSITENRRMIVAHTVMASLSMLLLSSFSGMLLPGLPLKTPCAAHLLTSTEAEKNPNGNIDQIPAGANLMTKCNAVVTQ